MRIFFSAPNDKSNMTTKMKKNRTISLSSKQAAFKICQIYPISFLKEASGAKIKNDMSCLAVHYIRNAG